MKEIFASLFLVLLTVLVSCEGSEVTPDDEGNKNSAPIIRLVYATGNYQWAGSTTNYTYDESGRLIIEPFFGHITYTQKDKNTTIATTHDRNLNVELTLEKNLCSSATYYWETNRLSEKRIVSNGYSNGRIASRKETITCTDDGKISERVYLSTFTWTNDNLASWESQWDGGGKSVTTFDYYGHLNPWANSLFDFTSAYFLESDTDDLPMEFVLGYIGSHSKNLLKAVYHDGILYITLTYDFDDQGRISKITERVDRNYSYYRWGSTEYDDRSCVFEIHY